MKVHHIGYVVKNVENDVEQFLNLGFVKTSDFIIDESRQIKIMFVKNESCLLELIEPLSADSSAQSILKKNGNSPYHVCFITEDIEKEVRRLRGEGYLNILKASPAVAFDHNLVAFMYKKETGLIEILEEKN